MIYARYCHQLRPHRADLSPPSCSVDPASSPTNRPFKGWLYPRSSESGARSPCWGQNPCLELAVQRNKKPSTCTVCQEWLTHSSPGRGGGSWSGCLSHLREDQCLCQERWGSAPSYGHTVSGWPPGSQANNNDRECAWGPKLLVTRQARN